MSKLSSLLTKKKKLVVGLMSGTSVDSVDAVLVSITGNGMSTRFKQIAFHSHVYPKGYKQFIIQHSLPGGGNIETISTLNILSAQLFADAVIALAKKANVPLSSIDLIGSHGQTMHHLPNGRTMFGKKIRSTLQIGDSSTIAKITGIVTVGDFRTGDMAHGGQGAPLVPFFDFIAFRSKKDNNVLLNIGGIANITVLQKNCSLNEVIAFDTGPGNMVVDALVQKLFGKPFDVRGVIASGGNVLPELLRTMFRHRYFTIPPPKSTGREIFGATFVEKILNSVPNNIRRRDIVATATEFTALTIYDQYIRFARPRLNGGDVDELIVSGGGSKNIAMMESLRRYFSPARVVTSDERGVSSDAKEALCFAILANETIAGNNANVPGVTGANRGTVLGKICL